MSRAEDVALIAGNAEWLAHRYDTPNDTVHFLKVPRADHRNAIFITDEFLPAAAQKVVLERAESMAAAHASGGPIHFIFHSAFCGSTLLARALDIDGVAMALKEPVILNDVTGWCRRGAEPRQIAEVLDDSIALLARRFAPGEATIVKPSNINNALAPAMLAIRPDAKAVLLYAPLALFLNSVARKQLTGRIWVRELFAGLLRDGIVELGFDADQFFGQTDLQIAAAGWLVQQALFARMVARFGPDRIRTLNSEDFIADPGTILAAVAALFELNLSVDRISAIANGPVFNRHSKTGGAFDAGARSRDQAASDERHGEEIAQVVIWAEAVARAAGIAMAPGAPICS